MDEAAIHDLLSGRRRDLAAAVLRSGLHLASFAYSSAMSMRNLGYDLGLIQVRRAPVPVISLGNITTGGTGKTPFAAWLANWLSAHGRNPGLLSRGYRSFNRGLPNNPVDVANSTNNSNDEKLVLDRLCPSVPHLQQQDRVKSAFQAVSDFGCDTLILDDGFQHRRLHRDLDLLLIDALQPWGYEHVLPRGLLRESMTGLRRADLILVTRTDQCTAEQQLLLRAKLLDIRGTDEHVGIAFKPRRFVDLNWQPRSMEGVAGQKALIFCGIGNPGGFRRTVESLDITCGAMQAFPDHYHYTDRDLSQLADRARDVSADVVFTTQKDLVKISPISWGGPPLFAIEIGVEFVSGVELMESNLRRITA